MKIHLTVLVVKCVEWNDFVKTARHTLTDSAPQPPFPDSQKPESLDKNRDFRVNKHGYRLSPGQSPHAVDCRRGSAHTTGYR